MLSNIEWWFVFPPRLTNVHWTIQAKITSNTNDWKRRGDEMLRQNAVVDGVQSVHAGKAEREHVEMSQ